MAIIKNSHFIAIVIPFLLISTSGSEIPGRISGVMDCFNALYRIRSCSREISEYFAKGSLDLTPSCCGAISVVTRECLLLPDMLTALGYTSDQAYVLRGYCDADRRYESTGGLSPEASPAPTPAYKHK
ncbi:hypothetical protein M569_03529 [Genlisea aurea]|uniref:Prolamin-like domain-containing protein n=1 Tax=Genlisea aurea TaxID=192259 RepID=S8EF97_9LAMI|nr:hypothetical protein M569_03529 [Genlisea aurea]